MRVFALLFALLFVSSAYADGGYGTEDGAPAPAPPAPAPEEPTPDTEMSETADEMEKMEEAEPAADSYAEEPAAPPAPAPEEEEEEAAPATDAPAEEAAAPATDAPAEPAPEEEAAPATDAPEEAPAAEEGYGPPPEMPEVPEEPEDTDEAPEEGPAPEGPGPAEEGGYRRRRVLKMSDIRLADIHLKFNMNCMDHHEFCEFWASIKKGTAHPLTGLLVERSECFRNRRLIDFDGCPKACGICTNNQAEWALRRRLASRKLAFLRRTRKILL